MKTTSLHQSLADRIKADIIAAQALYREDPNLAVAVAECNLRAAWNSLSDRIIVLHGLPTITGAAPDVLRGILHAKARYPRPRRWSLARLLGLG